MFMNWKVPERVATSDCSRANSRFSRNGEPTKNNIPHANLLSPSALPAIEPTMSSKPPSRSRSAIPATPKLHPHGTSCERQNGTVPATPKLPLANDRLNTGASRLQTGASRFSKPPSLRASAPAIPTSRQSKAEKPMSSRKPKSFKITELLDRYYTPSDNPEEWFANASDTDRHMIEKVLQILEKDKVAKHNTKRALADWIEGASEKDRAVALQFFQSMAKENPNGEFHSQRPDKLDSVLQHLRSRHPAGYNHDDHKYRYLRLQTPNTRANKWMYQTWHHLPPRRDTNAVVNRTAIYSEPHKYVPSHYIIHPDLG